MTGRRKARARKGFLPLVVLLLLGSSLLRLENGAGWAWALQETRAEPPEIRQEGSAVTEDMLGDLIARLRLREAALAEREEDLQHRERVLERLAQEVDARLGDLERAEESLRATLALADTAAESDLSQLTTVYENMKPNDAAALFEKMDPGFSAGFLARMKPANAAAILSGLSPEQAYLISLVLSGRNMEAPTQIRDAVREP